MELTTILLGIIGFIVLMIVIAAIGWFVGKRKFNQLHGVQKEPSSKDKKKKEKSKDVKKEVKKESVASETIPSIAEDPKSGSKAEEYAADEGKVLEWKPPKEGESRPSAAASSGAAASAAATGSAAPSAAAVATGAAVGVAAGAAVIASSDDSSSEPPEQSGPASSSDLYSYKPPRPTGSPSSYPSTNIPNDPNRAMDPDAKIGIVGSSRTTMPPADSEFIVPLKKNESKPQPQPQTQAPPQQPVYSEPERPAFEKASASATAASAPSLDAEEKKKYNHKYAYFDSVMATDKENEAHEAEVQSAAASASPEPSPSSTPSPFSSPAPASVTEKTPANDGPKKTQFIDVDLFEDDDDGLQNEAVASKYTFDGDFEEEYASKVDDSKEHKDEKKKEDLDGAEPEY